MFRSLCSICADDITKEPFACPCGHIFHSICLNTWLRQSKTCPQCRLKTTAGIRLYLNECETSIDGGEDVGAVKAELEDVKGKLKKTKGENKSLKQTNTSLVSQLEVVGQGLEEQQRLNGTLKTQLTYFSKQQQELSKKKQELDALKEQLKRYERLEALLKKEHAEVENHLSSLSEGPKVREELVEQLIFIKREYERVKDCRNEAREKASRIERENKQLRTEKKSLEIELRKKTESLESVEKEIKQLESEREAYQRKIEVLHKALSSKDLTSPRTVAITRFVMESPAPVELKRPRLSPPEETLDDSIVLFDNSDAESTPSKPSTVSSDMEKAAMEVGIQCVKTTSTFGNQPSRKPLHDTNSAFKPRLLSGMAAKPKQGIKRPAPGNSSNSIIRKGFDGLGGHGKVLLPKSSVDHKHRKVARPSPSIARFVKGRPQPIGLEQPPLPSLSFD